MENSFSIEEQSIVDGKLYLKGKGVVSGWTKERIQVQAVFISEEQERRLPMSTVYLQGNDEECYFLAQGTYELPYIFYNTVKDSVTVHFYIRIGIEEQALSQVIELDKSHFHRREVTGRLFSWYRKVSFFCCMCLFPLFFLDGYFAQKGYKQLDTGENKAKGKKGIFLHINTLTKRISGYSYSVREHRTNYLKKKYEKYRKLSVIENQILFLSERPLEEGGNMDCVIKRLEKEPQLQLFSFIEPKTVDKLSRKELRKAAKWMAQSKMIILEDFYPQIHAIRLRKETELIQLWHACGAFKTFGYSRLGKVGGPLQTSMNHRSYQTAMVSGHKMVPIYSEAFGISTKAVKPFGVPRTDVLFDEEYQTKIRQRFYEKYPVLQQKKIVLFAPTFRGNGKKDAYYPVEKIDWNIILEQLPKEYLVIIKQHPFVKDKFMVDNRWQERFYDWTGKENINDILCITDLLITDYSSSVFEAAILNVPMIFFAFDQEEYLKDRDIYGDYRTFVPGDIVKNQRELLERIPEIIENQKVEQQNRVQKEFCENYLDALDGHSTERICQYILERVRLKEY